MCNLYMTSCKNQVIVLILHNEKVNILTKSKFFALELLRNVR